MIQKKTLKIISLSIVFVVCLASINVVSAYKAKKNQTSSLDETESEGLLFIREEEKMARDVYLMFADMYPQVSIFETIAQSEQKHMDSIKNLIDKYGLVDPVGTNDGGVFENQDIQILYDYLVWYGEQSLIDALSVGRYIEEYDIKDLRIHIGETDNSDLTQVYENLLEGSYNHLRAFVNVLDQYDGIYSLAPLLSEDDFNNIINSEKTNRKGKN